MNRMIRSGQQPGRPTSSKLSSTVEGSTSGWEMLLDVPAVSVSLSIRICGKGAAQGRSGGNRLHSRPD